MVTRPAAPALVRPRAKAGFYRGGPGMFTWVLHRMTGVALFAYLFAHVLDTALVVVDPGLYNGVIEVYHHWTIKLMEIGLVVAVIYHGLNGLRVTLVDFWSQGAARNGMMMRVQNVLFVVLTLGAVIPMTAQLISGLGE